MTWTHPKAGSILPLAGAILTEKTWKHFLDPSEQWNQLGADTRGLAVRAIAAGVPDKFDYGLLTRLPPSAIAELGRQHDEVWQFIYGSELKDIATATHQSVQDGRWRFASPKGIYASASQDFGGLVLLTVYRPHAKGLDVSWTVEQFGRHALRRLTRQASAENKQMSDRIRRLLDAPGDVGTTWELALELARARKQPESEWVDALAAALQGRSIALRKAATPDPGRILDLLESAIRVEDRDPMPVLLDVEDALEVTAELAGQAAAEELLERAQALLDWSPEPWQSIAPEADSLAGAAGIGQRLWAHIADVFVADQIGAAAATLEAPATVTERLLGRVLAATGVERPRVAHRRDVSRLVERAMNVGRRTAGWRRMAATLSEPSAVRVSPPEHLRAPASARAWVIDLVRAEVEEVTDLLHAPNAAIWELEPGDDVVVCWCADAGTPSVRDDDAASDLSDALDRAEHEPSAPVVFERFTRAS